MPDMQSCAQDDPKTRRLEHLNKVLKCSRSLNKLFFTSDTANYREFAKNICECLRSDIGYSRVWIALFNKEGSLGVFEENPPSPAFLELASHLSGGGYCRCVRSALKQDNPVVTCSTMADCFECPLASECNGEGGLTSRLAYEDKIFGIIRVAVPLELARDREGVEIFSGICEDISNLLYYREKQRGGGAGPITQTPGVSQQKHRTILQSIGDGVIATDVHGVVMEMNHVAEALTGWSASAAEGVHLKEVFHIVNASSRLCVDNPVEKVLLTGKIQGLANHTILISKNGTERQIADSAAPVIDVQGATIGVVLVFRDVTEEYAAIENLRQSREDYRNLFDNMLDGFVVCEAVSGANPAAADCRLISVNPAFEEITGLKAERIMGLMLSEVIPSLGHDLIQGFAGVGFTGESLKFERYFSDFEKYLEFLVFCPERGKVACVFRDVTRRKLDEQEIRERERKYDTLISNLPGFSYYCKNDYQWTMEYVSIGVTTVTGYDPEDFIQNRKLSYNDIIVPEFQEYVWLSFQKAIRNKTTAEIEYQIKRKDGSVAWVWERGKGLYDLQGELIYIEGYIEDITKRKLAVQNLQLTQKRYELAQKMSGLGTWQWDFEDNSLIWDEQLFKLFHVEPENFECTFDAFLELVVSEDRKKVIEAVSACRDYGEIYEVEFRIQDKNHKVSRIRAVGNIVTDDEGRAMQMVGIVEDITERRQLERDLHHMEKMEAIGKLAGGIAHDFNNQLGGIIGCADLLSARVGDPRLKELAEEIVNISQHCADLTGKLLAFARKGQFQSVAVNMHLVIAEVVAILAHTVDKRIRIEKHLDAVTPVTLGDPSQLQNALLNLALNARDAMPEGGELIFSTATAMLDEKYCAGLPYEITPGKYLSVSVTDSGVGIAERDMEHIFEPFYTTKEVGCGSGMGLAAVYGTLKSHRGAINVYSEVGVGTTFRLFLPLYRHEQVVIDNQEKVPEVLAVPHLKIMVVDDEPMIRGLIGSMIEEMGSEVHLCQNGQEGVEYYQQNWREIDLVILDMIMPVMGGREAFRLIKEINPQARVILASGYSINGEAQNLLDEGVMGFIQKPFRKQELMQAICSVVK